MTFYNIDAASEIPYELLLLADETKEAIDKYIFECNIYILNNGSQDIAVIALYKNNETELEIKNMAVIEAYRSKGIGNMLINQAKEIAKENHYTSLIVGTSDTGFQQIKFYEKNGFIKKGIRKDFFITNYPFPIYENGLQMHDMLILAHDLSE
ncbi:GNAT family N-acetyltransferase [Chryseobacterium polytrichastri]|uniref:Acetyltransferase (GNAT) domain-containing protein n=1 Tax=Chryseobacterium polytrichastri TaxID=1302687 RepID=A0A1M6SQ97_9FLAO|nr:GNAT family N-acetyltransferase [Chryseobacterium polytrichastri]SHK46810.1 Acetyltransferase (GNAT) domain-containing protein [Chryseobacterium polytrichastri]